MREVVQARGRDGLRQAHAGLSWPVSAGGLGRDCEAWHGTSRPGKAMRGMARRGLGSNARLTVGGYFDDIERSHRGAFHLLSIGAFQRNEADRPRCRSGRGADQVKAAGWTLAGAQGVNSLKRDGVRVAATPSFATFMGANSASRSTTGGSPVTRRLSSSRWSMRRSRSWRWRCIRRSRRRRAPPERRRRTSRSGSGIRSSSSGTRGCSTGRSSGQWLRRTRRATGSS